MNKDDILIVKYPFLMKNDQATKLRDSILKQKENGVIILPDYCEVVIAPKDTEVKIENDEQSTPWFFVDNPNYSSFDYSNNKEMNIRCDKCGKTIESWDDNYTRCPYCGKKHTFGAEEKEGG